MKNKTVFLIISLCIFCYVSLFSLNLYVSPSGNDANSGTTTASPLKTLEGARDEVRDRIAGGISEDIIVRFRQGVYYMDSPVVFNNLDSIPTGNRVVYENYGNEEVFFAGGRKITGWMDYNAHIMYTHVGLVDLSVLYENRDRGVEIQNPGEFPTAEIIQDVNSPGEYYYNTGSGYLYYFPRNNPVENQCIFIPETDSIIELRGTSDTSPVKNITFSDLIILGTKLNPAGISNYYNETGLIYMENAESITVDSCELLGAGISGIVAAKYAQQISITKNRIDGFNLHGVSLRGYLPGDGGYSKPGLSDVNNNNSVTENFITSGGYKSSSGSGIRVSQSGNNKIKDNRIRYISGNGIMLHGPSSSILGEIYYDTAVNSGNVWSFLHAKNNSIQNNDISRITPGTGGGGIYLYQAGRGDTIVNNCIHDIYITGTTVTPTGIYLGYLTENVSVENNIIHTIVGANNRGRSVFVSGNNCTIENNVFSRYGVYGGIGFNASSGHSKNLTIKHNIFYRNNGQYFYHFTRWDNPDFIGSNNNLFYHPGGKYLVDNPYPDYDITDWRQESAFGYDNNSITAQDPLFEEPESHYYRLRGGSPALLMDITSINQDTIGPGESFVHRYARDVIEAEEYNDSSGITALGTTIRSSSFSNSAGYYSVYFESGLLHVEMKLSCDAPFGVETEREIEIRLGSSSGTLLGTIPVEGTGGLSSYIIKRTNISGGVSGVHNVYLKFQESSPDVKVDWFRFYGTSPPQEPQVNLNHAPVVEIISPGNNDQISVGNNVIISAKATDDDGSVERMRLFAGGTLLYETDGSFFSYTWQAPPLGDHTIQVVATDNNGSSGQKEITIHVSNTVSDPPFVEILKPQDGEEFTGPANITIIVNAEDINDGIRSIQVFGNNQLLHTTDSSPLEYTWTNVLPGDYRIRALATDNSGATADDIIDIWVNAENYLIGRWEMEAIESGGFVRDSSGKEHHGRASGVTETYGVKGAGAYYFDGNGSVDIQIPLINNFKYLTMTGWIKPETGGTRMGFFGQEGVISFGFLSDLLISIFTDNRGGLETGFPKNHLNKWHHVAMVANGDEGLRIYYDGSLKAGPTKDLADKYGSSHSSFKIGGGGIFSSPNENFKGAIDDVRVYSYILSETELKALASKTDNIRPDVKIIYPKDGSNVDGPVDMTIVVEADDRNGTVTQVEVYTNEYMIGTDYESPYEFDWTFTPGKYILTAKVWDNENATNTHTISFTVTDQSDIIAYWSFDEGKGNIASDSEGGNHGTVSFAEWEEGIYGSCLFFDGYGTVSINEQLSNGLSEFTLAYWMKPESLVKFTGIMGQIGAFMSSLNETCKIAAWTEKGSFNTFCPLDIPLNEWTHVATVATGKELIIYINGKAAAMTSAHIQEYEDYGSSDSNFEMGWLTAFNSRGSGFKGSLDEVYYYRRALSEDEIKMLARPPDPEYPSVQFVSPQHLSQHIIGEAVPIQASAGKAGMNGLYLELYIDDGFITVLEEPYTMEWFFQETGDHVLSLRICSDTKVWAENTVTVSIVEEGEIEDGNDDTGDDIFDDTGDNSDPFGWNDDGGGDGENNTDDDSSGTGSTRHYHSSGDGMYREFSGNEEDIHDGETFLEYIERKNREYEEKKKQNEGDNNGNSNTTNKIIYDEDGNPVTGYAVPINGNDKNDQGNDKENNTRSGSTNAWTWLFGNTGSVKEGDKHNNRPGFIYLLIVFLAVTAGVITGVIIIKKFINRKKRYYYYE